MLYQEPVQYYEGTLTAEAWDGPCTEQEKEQKVTMALKKHASGYEGYLNFQDGMMAKLFGGDADRLEIQLLAPSGRKPSQGSITIENVDNVQTICLEIENKKVTIGCRIYLGIIHLRLESEPQNNFQSLAQKYSSQKIIGETITQLASGSLEVAFSKVKKINQQTENRETIKDRVAESLLEIGNSEVILETWINLAREEGDKANKEIELISSLYTHIGNRLKRGKDYIRSLKIFQSAVLAFPFRDEFWKEAAELSILLDKKDRAIFYLKEAVKAALFAEKRLDVKIYHEKLEEISSDYQESTEENNPDTHSLNIELKRIIDIDNNKSKLKELPTIYDKIKEKLGKKNPHSINTLIQLGMAYGELNELSKAEEILNHAQKESQKSFSSDHPVSLILLDAKAKLYLMKGDYSRSKKLLNDLLEKQKINLGEDHYDTLITLNNIATIHGYLGDYDKAFDSHKIVLEKIKAHIGEFHPSALTVNSNIAMYYLKTGGLENAEKIFIDVFKKTQRVFGEKSKETIHCLFNLGMLNEAKGEYGKAKDIYEKSLQMCIDLLGENSLETSIILNSLGTVCYQKGLYNLSQQYLERSLQIGESLNGLEHPIIINILNNLALTYEMKGLYYEAEIFFEYCLQIRRKILGNCHPDTLVSINNLGTFYYGRSNYELSLPLLIEAVDSYDKVFGPLHPGTLNSKTNLGTTYRIIGMLGKGQELLRETVIQLDSVLGKEHPLTITSKNNLALILEELGKYNEAQAIFEEILVILKKTSGVSHPNTLYTMSSLASIYERQGKINDAQDLYESTFSIFTEAHGMENPMLYEHINNMIYFYNRIKKNNKAKDISKVALEKSISWFGKNSNKTVNIYNSLIAINTSLGDYDEANYYFESVKDYIKGETLQDMSIAVEIYFNMAFLSIAEGNHNKASHFMNIALTHSQSILTEVFSLPRFDGRSFIEKMNDYRDGFFSFYLGYSSYYKEESLMLFSFAQKGLLFRVSQKNLFDLNSNPDSKNDYKIIKNRILNIRRKMSHYALINLNNRENINKVNKLSKELGSLEIKNSASFTDDLPINHINIGDLYDKITLDSIVVDFHVYGKIDFENNKKLGQNVAAVLVSTYSQPQISVIDLGPVSPILEQLEYFRLGNKILSEKLVTTSSKNLYRRLWKPIESFFSNKHKIYLIPDGPLNLIPFEALVNDHDQYLVSNYSIQRLTSLHDFIENEDQGFKSSKPSIIYDPNYNLNLQHHTSSTETFRKFTPLPNLNCEGEAIEQHFRGRGLSPYVLRGNDATEASVSAIRSPYILHIASHGFFLGDMNMDKFDNREKGRPLMLRDFEQDKSDPSGIVSGKRPLLRSGIALAGANAGSMGQVEKDGTDGILTAFEVLSMDLRGTNLVVLSACDTGIGEPIQGQGVYSLNRAFLEAGANAVMATLWSVDDEATSVFMDRFYDKYLNGFTASESLRFTQLEFIDSKEWSHPYYWAPFVIVGEL
jgi:CHAT domain-containing protein